MGQHRDKEKTPDQNSQSKAGSKTDFKKPYVAPVLVEYGTIAKLTQGTRTTSRDGANTKRSRRTCL